MTDTTRRGFFKRLGLAAGSAAVLPFVPKGEARAEAVGTAAEEAAVREAMAETLRDFTTYPHKTIYISATLAELPAPVEVNEKYFNKLKIR